jgi:DGQHR domain-containing protein
MLKNNTTLITQRVEQNNQEFLLGVFSISEILKFTRYTEYTILGFDEENDNKPITKNEVQRKLISSKVNSIVDFIIHDPLAIFPTNLVISIPNHIIKNLDEIPKSTIIEIELEKKVFNEITKIDNKTEGDVYLSIIDGQHRVRGIEKAIEYFKNEIKSTSQIIRSSKNTEIKYENKLKELYNKLKLTENIQLPVTFFIDPVLEYQAMIFSTINRTQTKVPPDLVYSLFGLSSSDSPQKTVLNIVNTLNGKKESPFYKRIRLAGAGSNSAKKFYKEGNPVLSQTTVVKSILSMICKNQREQDISRHKKRSFFLKDPDKSLYFRKYYGNDEDQKIIRVLYSYFIAIKKVFIYENHSIWNFEDANNRKPKNILQTTIGFLALLEILKIILSKGLVYEDENDKVSPYLKILEKATSVDFLDDNEPKKYPFNSKTKNILIQDIGIKIFGKDFNYK